MVRVSTPDIVVSIILRTAQACGPGDIAAIEQCVWCCLPLGTNSDVTIAETTPRKTSDSAGRSPGKISEDECPCAALNMAGSTR